MTIASASQGTLESYPSVDDRQFSLRRLIGFLTLHLLAFIAQGLTIAYFTYRQNFFSLMLVGTPFLFSGVFCAYAAWYCQPPQNADFGSLLPLRDQSLLVAGLLTIPYGLCQWVVVELAVEEHRRRNRTSALLSESEPSTGWRSVNRFHVKAVCGVFEGITSSIAIIYAYWGIGFPRSNPITSVVVSHEKLFLGIAGGIATFSAGMGLLELDFCASRVIAHRMSGGLSYEILHWLFRTCEVVSRISFIVGFMVITQSHGKLTGWILFFADFLVTYILVTLCGGSEVHSFVRFFCAIPCSFTNIFLFIDSPYKRRAARNLSVRLMYKNLLELAAVALWFTSVQKDWSNGLELLKLHPHSILISFVSFPLYWILLWWTWGLKRSRNEPLDIYTACQAGNITAVRHLVSRAVGLDVNRFDVDGKTPLMLAVLNGHSEVCELLVQEGARVDTALFEDHLGIRRVFWRPARRCWTALHMSAWCGKTKVIEALLSGPVIRSPDKFYDKTGATPLHVAARSKNIDAARLLARQFPEWVNAEDSCGKKPRDVARSREMVNVLCEEPLADGVSQPKGTELVNLSDPAQPWKEVHLPIVKSFREGEGQRVAPGLCSFLATSSGGALGHMFLIEQLQAPLQSIDEDAVSVGPSLPTRMMNKHSPHQAQVLPTIDALEPATENGEPVAWWCDMRARESDSAIASGRLIARVPMEAEIGVGSFGQVWRARDHRTKVVYAVKNIKAGCGRHAAMVASREMDMANFVRLQPHPCIVTLYQVNHFPDVGLYCLLMENCPHGDLEHRITQHRGQNGYTLPRLARNWIGQIFLGLEHVHLHMNLLLRDLKIENVVLSDRDFAKLTDFGLGRFGAECNGSWSFGMPPGSPGYISPEVLREERYGWKADLYSFGAVVWVLLTGGVTDSKTPRPPMSDGERNFKRYFEDWQLLRKCIEEPEENNARPLPEDARELLLGLVQRRPDARPGHDEIRKSALLEPLGLPGLDAHPDELQLWLMKGTESPTRRRFFS